MSHMTYPYISFHFFFYFVGLPIFLPITHSRHVSMNLRDYGIDCDWPKPALSADFDTHENLTRH